MALKQLFTFVIVVALVLPRITSAAEFIVGDDKGWTINFDYQNWAKDKAFHVGDILVFKYPVGLHNVFKVNGTGFKDCTKPPTNEALVTGNDVITLATPGNKWYICGIADHCADKNQKLAITVLPEWQALAPSPMTPNSPTSPITPNSAIGVAMSRYQVLIGTMVAITMIFFV